MIITNTRGVFCTVIFLAAISAMAQERPGGGRVVARANDDIITSEELEKNMGGMPQAGGEALRRKTLQNLVVKKLVLQEAQKYEITVKKEDVDKAIEKDRKRFDGDEAFQRHIRQVYGLSLQEYWEEKKTSMISQKLYGYLYSMGYFYPKNSSVIFFDYVSPEEVRAYYEANRGKYKGIDDAIVSRIALAYKDEKQKEERREEAESVLRRIREGASFNLLARYHSDLFRDNFGRMPVVHRDENTLPKDLHDLVFTRLKPGEISGIVDDGSFLNIVRLDRKVNEKARTYEEAQPEIQRELENQKRFQNEQKLKDELIKKAYIWPADLFSERSE